jgi:hypothetical protein
MRFANDGRHGNRPFPCFQPDFFQRFMSHQSARLQSARSSAAKATRSPSTMGKSTILSWSSASCRAWWGQVVAVLCLRAQLLAVRVPGWGIQAGTSLDIGFALEHGHGQPGSSARTVGLMGDDQGRLSGSGPAQFLFPNAETIHFVGADEFEPVHGHHQPDRTFLPDQPGTVAPDQSLKSTTVVISSQSPFLPGLNKYSISAGPATAPRCAISSGCPQTAPVE